MHHSLEAFYIAVIVCGIFLAAGVMYGAHCLACDVHAWWIKRRERLAIERLLGKAYVPARLRIRTSHR